MIKRLEDGRWLADIEPVKGKRHRKKFKVKSEALRFEATIRAKYARDKDWNTAQQDPRSLQDLIEQWYLLHGQTLTDGQRRRNSLKLLADRLRNPKAINLTGAAFTEYRGKALKAGTTGKTLNNQLGYLRSVYNELLRLGDISYQNPLAAVRPLKLQERELAYLTTEQITVLFESIRKHCQLPHALLVAEICLITGCRWSEAQSLTPSRVRDNLVTFINTKSKKARSVPIPIELSRRIHQHFDEWGHFSRCLDAFGKAADRSGLTLPRGQKSHVLRHTFASHFVMNGGNILTLQKILGHSTITMTMRYAHLAPDHLQEALQFGPAVKLRQYFDTEKGEQEKNEEKQGCNGAPGGT